MHTNIEIKAKCSSHDKIRKILRANNARFCGMDKQIDTYFKVMQGRLKLREGKLENYLVYYERENKKQAKQSSVMLFKTEKNSELKEILAKSLGILAKLEKYREIYSIKNVRFNLDNVRDLGTFVEIEVRQVQGKNMEKKKLLQQCSYYKNLLNIQKNDLIAGSYSDLLQEK